MLQGTGSSTNPGHYIVGEIPHSKKVFKARRIYRRIVNPDAKTDYVPYSQCQDWALSEVLGPYLFSACSVDEVECWNIDFPLWISQPDGEVPPSGGIPASVHDWRVIGDQDV
jgi:hypothetical protein